MFSAGSSFQVKGPAEVGQAGARLGAGEASLGRMDIPFAVIARVAQSAMTTVRPIVKAMINSNYAASGIGSRTGALARAIAAVEVGIYVSPVRPWKVWVLYPRGLPDYKYDPKTSRGKASDTPFYRVAAALNYGAVYPPKSARFTATAAARRKAKAAAAEYGAKVTISALRFRGKGKMRDVAYRVVRGRHFFDLTSGQRLRVQAEFTRAFSARMRGLFQRKAA